MTKTDDIRDFEKSMQELEQIVTSMEKDTLSLAESLQAFERGVTLGKHCQAILAQAEQKVQTLLEQTPRQVPDTEKES